MTTQTPELDRRAEEGGTIASLPRRIWRSAFPQPLAAHSDRERAQLTRFTFLLHLRPVRLPASTLRWTHTFGLGGSSLVLFSVLAATGILMMLHYHPSPDTAWRSVWQLEREVSFGALVRGVHWWSANLLIVVLLAHTARVFLTGGYHGPRKFNWVIGCCLLASVLAAAFTGYLLPWDQLAYWAVTISTGMLEYVPLLGEPVQRVLRGGETIGAATLVTFFTLHTTIVPVLLIALMGFHFWRVRRAGGVVDPLPSETGEDRDGPEKVLFLPNLLVRELGQALVVVAVVVVLGAVVGAPLGEAANPGMSPNPAKAPWYFMGFQELLIHLHPLFAIVVVPLLAGVGLILLPYLTPDDEPAGPWFRSRRGRRAAAIAAGAAVIATPLVVVLDELRTASPGWFTGGVVPLALVAAATLAIAIGLRRRLGTTAGETVQAVVVLLAVAFAVLTVVGVWFRGEGMALTWPWTT
jgi:quinol-cytochrome oxidoreductase complex cytochrome b subunit